MPPRPSTPGWPGLALIALGLAVSLLSGGGPRPRAAKPVLVYLTNETRPAAAGARAYAEVESWLRESGDPLALEAADRLALDREAFPAAVDTELAAVEVSAAPRVFAVTNASLRSGRAILRRTAGALSEHALAALPRTTDHVVDESPLATLEGVVHALSAAVAAFPADEHEYVVVLKSHGGDGLVAIPRLTVRPAESSPEEVLALLHGEAAPSEEGIRRADLLTAIEGLGIDVRLLVLESCGGGLGLVASELPRSIAAVAAAPGSASYDGFDLARLGVDPVEELVRQVDARPGMRVVRRPADPRPLAALPALLVVGVLGWGSVRGRRSDP